MQMLKVTDGVSVKLPNGPVGINFSGGADSTILVFLVMSQLSVPLHLITTTVSDRDNSHKKTTKAITDKLCQLTSNTDIHFHYNHQETSQSGISTLFDLSKQLIYKDRIVNSILTGITANPPGYITDSFKNSEVEPSARDSSITRPIRRAPGWFNPLTNLNKQDICKIYYDNNILDSVFPLTKSCWTDFGEPPCGSCWFCEERDWGLKFNPQSS